MANIIDQTFFVRENLIPGVEQASVYQVVCQFVAQYEPIFMERSLTYQIYKDLLAAVAIETPPTEGKWFELMFGGEYTYKGETQRWRGFKSKSTDAVKWSIIANYVYYYYMRNEVTQTATVGQVVTNQENAQVSTAAHKMQKAWNDMCEQVVNNLWLFLANKTEEDGETLAFPDFSLSKIKRANISHFTSVNTLFNW